MAAVSQAHTRRIDVAKRAQTTIDAVEIPHRRFYEGKPKRLKGLEEERANEEFVSGSRSLLFRL